MLLVANWKMAPEKMDAATALAKATLAIAHTYKKTLEVIVCPSFVHLAIVAKLAKAPLKVGAQDVAADNIFAQTGLVGAAMIKSAGASYCIMGHSEARARGGSNESVYAATSRLIEKKITPIVCIGERARDNHGWYLGEVKDQLELLLQNVPKAILKSMVIAYEPVWAIGVDAVREATAPECREMIIYIRKLFADTHGDTFAKNIRIIYGGSVHERNAAQFMTDGGADGLLVGRVSLEPKRLALIAKAISAAV